MLIKFSTFFLVLSSYFELTKSLKIIDFSSPIANVSSGEIVTFTCAGNIFPGLRERSIEVDYSIWADETSYSIRANISDNNLRLSCTNQNRISYTTLNVLFEPILDNNQTYYVVIGKEQSVIINYKQNPHQGSIILTKNDSTKSNFYEQRISDVENRIVLHFLEVTSEDLGQYIVELYDNNFVRVAYAITIEERKISKQPENSQKNTAINRQNVGIIISPVLSFVICVIAVGVAICLVKKKASNLKATASETNENPYVPSGEGKPAHPPLVAGDIAPQPHCDDVGSQRHWDSAGSPPLGNDVGSRPYWDDVGSRPPGDDAGSQPYNSALAAEALSNYRLTHPPPVTKRTTSLTHTKPESWPLKQLPVDQSYTSNCVKTAESNESLDSFDTDNEYELFQSGPVKPSTHTPFSLSMNMPSIISSQHNRIMKQQRPHAAMTKKPLVAPKPTTHFYQNQMFLKKYGEQMRNDESDEEEIVYEGMN